MDTFKPTVSEGLGGRCMCVCTNIPTTLLLLLVRALKHLHLGLVSSHPWLTEKARGVKSER